MWTKWLHSVPCVHKCGQACETNLPLDRHAFLARTVGQDGSVLSMVHVFGQKWRWAWANRVFSNKMMHTYVKHENRHGYVSIFDRSLTAGHASLSICAQLPARLLLIKLRPGWLYIPMFHVLPVWVWRLEMNKLRNVHVHGSQTWNKSKHIGCCSWRASGRLNSAKPPDLLAQHGPSDPFDVWSVFLLILMHYYTGWCGKYPQSQCIWSFIRVVNRSGLRTITKQLGEHLLFSVNLQSVLQIMQRGHCKCAGAWLSYFVMSQL